MVRRLHFLVNGSEVLAVTSPGKPALDYIRDDLGLKGAKEGCREGDCGACAVLVGTRYHSSEGGAVLAKARVPDGLFSYKACPSCLLAMGELDGRHLVTIEGLVEGARQAERRIRDAKGITAGKTEGPADGLTPVMRALLEENGSQCGFCSPGIVISLTGWLLSGPTIDLAGAIKAVEGNLCRCTGYGAIRRAASRLAAEFADLPSDQAARLSILENAGVVPASIGLFCRGELLGMSASLAAAKEAVATEALRGTVVLGGGTDWYVRNPDPEPGFEPRLMDMSPAYTSIEKTGDMLEIGAAVTMRDFFASTTVRASIPGIDAFEADIASSLIRGRATLGGNVGNASPVADITAILLALGATVVLEGGAGKRETPLSSFFLGYKKLDLGEGEFLARFRIKDRPAIRFNFEKVSKRRRLDIASVNSAACFELDTTIASPRMLSATISAGGVAATPLVLVKTNAFLVGRKIDGATVREAAAMAAGEISPISDVRGSADYRRRLLERLVMGHFIRLFPETGIAEELFP